MTSFTTDDRLNAEKDAEPIPFAGWIYSNTEQSLESTVELLRDQVHAQNSEIIRLSERVRYLESILYGSGAK
jgi:hypothetical protein